MALQGDLDSFALPDVLRLLAGTGKSGRLEVTGKSGSGEVLLRKGSISSAAATMAPHASDPSDVVFELLRFDGGSFDFEEGSVSDKGISADVEETISLAEALVAEWTEIEQVVPSMDAWLTLVPEVEGDDVTVSAAHWQAIAAIGSGGNVHDLAAALELTDLAASRRVMEMVEAELLLVRANHSYTAPVADTGHDGYAPPSIELDDFEQYERQLDDPISDFEDLVAEERPVVMEDREDALLPEPLPGEGVAYEGETITGSVDGRTFDTIEAIEDAGSADVGAEDPSGQDGDADPFEAFESLAAFEAEAAMSDLAGEPGTIDGFGDADPFDQAVAGDGSDFEISDADEVDDADEADEVDEVDEAAAELEQDAATDEADEPVDDERDSLLKFLSSVKP